MINRGQHILILVQNLPVPFDRRVWMESTALTEAGYRVSVISPQPAKLDGPADTTIEGINVYRYTPPPPTNSKLSFIYEFYYCYRQTERLVKQIWRNDPFDAIHSCNPPDTFWRIARGYKKHGVKFVFDHHDLCPELFESKFNKRGPFWHGLSWLERKQFETADAVIATNESYKRAAIERGGVAPDRACVVRSGPRLNRFQRVTPQPELKRGKRHLGVYLGVMGAQDGVDYALRAIRSALDAGLEDCAFTFVGSGDDFDRLIALNRELNLEEHVTFTGRVPDEELKTILSTADFGIAPDPKNPLNDVSTMNKIIEYMAMGLPIISFDLIESRVSAGDAAIYVENDDCDEMGRQMIQLLQDDAARERMSKAGLARVREGLSWDYSKEVLLDFYDGLFANVGGETGAASHAA